jgi:hypothetical protein
MQNGTIEPAKQLAIDGEYRSLTMLNECGDTTIAWSEENDDEMEKINAAIAAK